MQTFSGMIDTPQSSPDEETIICEIYYFNDRNDILQLHIIMSRLICSSVSAKPRSVFKKLRFKITDCSFACTAHPTQGFFFSSTEMS